MNILLELFLTFAQIGLFTFGGGYAMIPIIEAKCVDRKKWITHEEMVDMTVIAESTPGPIAINCATFTGYKKAGIWGAVAATAGMIIPSFLVIYPISVFLDNFLELTVVANAFKGIKVAVALLILDAGISMLKKMKRRVIAEIIVGCSCAMMLCINIFAWKFSTIGLLLIAAIFYLTVFVISGAPDQKGGVGK